MHIENSLFAENHAEWPGGGLSYGNGNDTPPRALTFVGNSFHRQTQSGSGPGRTLKVAVPADASGWALTFSGNLFDPAANPIVGDECHIGGGNTQPPTLHGGDNLSPDADCLFLGAADIQANPMVVASVSGDALKPMLLLPQPGSPAVDAWPTEACMNHLDQPLDHDLRGEPRPTDGDGSGIADCDIGAFELPSVTTDLIFANGFD